MIRRWRPSLRMARREVLRHKTRTLLSVILIMVPVLVATVVALYAHNLRYEGEHQARVTMGGADALVRITPYTKAKVGYPDGWMYVRPGETVRGKDGKKHAVRRPVTDVDLTSLLPDGTRIVAAPTSRQVGAAERRHGLPPVPRRRRPVGGRALPRHRREGAREGRRGRDQERAWPRSSVSSTTANSRPTRA